MTRRRPDPRPRRRRGRGIVAAAGSVLLLSSLAGGGLAAADEPEGESFGKAADFGVSARSGGAVFEDGVLSGTPESRPPTSSS